MRYRLVASRLASVALAAVIVGASVTAAGASATPSTSEAAVSSRADVFAYGHASLYGSTGTPHLADPIVGVAATPNGRGYWLVASDGGIFSFGDARFHGSTGALHLNQPIVGMASTPSGRGYWLAAAGGGMFSFGDASFHGSVTAASLSRPIVGMASTPSGRGYWLVSGNGHVFRFGDAARFAPATAAGARTTRGSSLVSASIVGIAASAGGRGFWLAADGTSGPKAESAIAWFDARIGSGAYEGLCETAVELAYGTINQYPSARADWLARPDKHSDWWNAPRGALVFYDTSGNGHVAISIGNGEVVSTSINHRIEVAPVGFLQNPLGWASAPW
jgi:hypothetical protein